MAADRPASLASRDDSGSLAEGGGSPGGGANPFAPPASSSRAQTRAVAAPHYGDASRAQRLANALIDFLGYVVFLVFIVAGLVVAGLADAIRGPISGQLFSIMTWFLYYFLLERLLGRTLGKLVTGTKVVTRDGGRPTALQLIVRTAVRFVPLEALSLLDDHPRGWHDLWSGTRVVRIRPTEVDRMMERIGETPVLVEPGL